MRQDDTGRLQLLTELGLSPVRLEDKPVFDRVFGALKRPISDYTFCGAYMWAGALRLGWRTIERHLCVFAAGRNDLTMLLPPLAGPDAADGDLRAAVDACFEIMDGANRTAREGPTSRIEYVSDELLERVVCAKCDVSAAAIWGDYVYDTARMIDLAGGDLKSKRKARSGFMRNFPDHRVEPLDRSHVHACLGLLERWGEHADEVHAGETTDASMSTEELRDRDRVATRAALEEYERLGLSGMTLWVGDRLAGFTLGEPLSPAQAVVHAEKTDPRFEGAPQMIFSAFCETCWGEFPEINAGDDWGIPGLRFAKQSYRPSRMLAKYVLTRTPIAQVAGGMDPVIPPQNPPHAVAPTSGPRREVRLRAAMPDDLSAIERVERLCFDPETESFNSRQITGLISNPNAAVHVAMVDEEIAGWGVGLVRFNRHPRSGVRYRLGRLYSVAVLPEHRGMGIGRRLVIATIEALHGMRAERISLEVREGNLPAITLYESLGFTMAGRLPEYYGPGAHGRRMVLLGPVG